MTVLQLLKWNAKIGKDELEGDSHDTSNNGKRLLEMTERQHMTTANRLNKCKVVLTRERTANGKVEKSVIDYIITCKGLK